jgi:acetyl esterase/lipase
VGDSAGGNLCAALINLLISWNLPVPNGLVLVYPVLDMSPKKYSRSLLGTLSDLILPHTLLKLCYLSYVKL